MIPSTLSPCLPSLTPPSGLPLPPRYPTATLLPNKLIMIMGGTQQVGAGSANSPVYEIWDPSTPGVMPTTRLVNPQYLASVKQNYYPFNFVLPTGDMFNFCGRYVRACVTVIFS